MDLNSTRTAANTVEPVEKPKTYGDTLHDFFIENRSQFEPAGITPDGLAKKAYEQHGAASGKDYDTWSNEVGLGDFVPRTQSRLAELKEEDDWKASQPEDRGFLAGTGAALGRGAMNVVGAAGQTLGLADATPGAIDTDKGLLDRAGEGMVNWAEEKKANTQFMRPTKEEDAGEVGMVKAGWEGALESLPLTGGVAASAAAGAGIGSLAGPVGTAVGATVGGLVGMAGLFGAGTYGDSYDRTYKELKTKRPDATEDEVRAVAQKGALIDAGLETGSELVSDLAAVMTLGGSKMVTQPLTKTLKEIVKPGFKTYLLNTAKHMPFEVGSEVATAYGQADWREKEGLEGGDRVAAMGDAVLPAIFMSAVLGTAVAGYREVTARKTLSDLNADDQNVRVKAAEDVAARIVENTEDKELAKTWLDFASQRIQAGEKIDVDEAVAQWSATKTREDAQAAGRTLPSYEPQDTAPEGVRGALNTPKSEAEKMLTGDEDVTPTDILMGNDERPAPVPGQNEAWLDEQEAAYQRGQAESMGQTEDLDAEWQNRAEERQVAADTRMLDAEWDTRQRIQELEREIKSLSTGRGKGTKKRMAAAQEAKRELKRLRDSLASAAPVSPEVSASSQAVGSMPVESVQNMQELAPTRGTASPAVADTMTAAQTPNLAEEMRQREETRAINNRKRAELQRKITNLEALGSRASAVQTRNLEAYRSELDAIDAQDGQTLDAEARGVEEFGPATAGSGKENLQVDAQPVTSNSVVSQNQPNLIDNAANISEPPTLPADQRTQEQAGGMASPGQRPSVDTNFDNMVKDAARWRGAARNLARELKNDKRASVRLSKITTKGDLDAYLMRKYGIDEVEARSVSNHLTAQDVPDDMAATVEEFKDEPWAKEMLKAQPKPKKPLVKKAVSERHAALADYFTPGNVVGDSFGYDRVISFSPADEKGNWSVTVMNVRKDDKGNWVDVPGARQRTHATMPGDRELKAGPVKREGAIQEPQAAPEKKQMVKKADQSPVLDRATYVRQIASLMRNRRYRDADAAAKTVVERLGLPKSEVKVLLGEAMLIEQRSGDRMETFTQDEQNLATQLVPSLEWVQINRDKTVESTIPDAAKEKLTLKQQKEWLLVEIDKAMKSDAKGGKPFEFHVPGDGHFRVKAEQLAEFKKRVEERFPEKERPSALGKNPPRPTQSSRGRITEGEYYNEWQDNEVKIDAIFKPEDKDSPFPAWDAKTSVLHNGVALVVLPKKPMLKGVKENKADVESFLKHSAKEISERAEIVGQFKRAGLSEEDESRRLAGDKKTRDMLNEYADNMATVFAHVRYGDKDAFFHADKVDMLRTQYPDAEIRVSKNGTTLGMFVHGKVVGIAMGVEGVELSDYHKARIEEIAAAKEGRSPGVKAADAKVETKQSVAEEVEMPVVETAAKQEAPNPVTGRTRWLVDYSETNKERTTETKSFATLAEAREFAKGKSGYISKQEDAGSGLSTDATTNAFKEYFGDFDPSAQEGQKMKAAFGEVPATTATGAGMRKATKAGLARVAEAKKAMAAIVNNPDIVGKDRADRIENARNLVNFLETNAANDLDTGYEFGDMVAYTGEDAPEGMRAFIYLDGAKAGKTGVAATKETKGARATKAQEDFKKQQEEFSRLKQDAPQPAPPTPAKIADFGEKIEGAKKDLWTGMREKMTAVSDDDIGSQPFSKTWPLPDYQAMLDSGVDKEVVSYVRAMRDAIPNKPGSSRRSAYKTVAWEKLVRDMRGLALSILDGKLPVANVRGVLARGSSDNSVTAAVRDQAELYMLVGHEKSLAGLSIQAGEYTLLNGVEYKPAKVIWAVEQKQKATAFSNFPRMLATGSTREEAIAEFKKKYDSLTINEPASKQVEFAIYSKKGTDGFFIGKKVGRNYIDLVGPLKTVKEAREYKREKHEELVDRLAKAKEIPNERRDTNNPRVGEDMRGGQDVTPEMFMDAFKFKGVQFGNYVEQGRRQGDLNEAFDALMDMAAILGIPPKAISLNGELALAFGARGSGGKNAYAAHYEPGQIVINLTKKRGAGSLGHEWFHALDNYFSRYRGHKSDHMTDALDVSLASEGSSYVLRGGVRKEMIDAFGAVIKAIRQTAMKARATKLDNKRTKEYWTLKPEMAARAFESYLISKLHDQGASNDYLANIVDEATWKAAESLGFELEDSYPYPTAGEVPTIRAAFDNFFSVIESRETDKGVALYQLANPTTPSLIDLRAAFTWADSITKDGDRYVVTKGKTSFAVKMVDSITPDKVAFELEYQRAFNPKTDQIAGEYKGATITVSRTAGNQWTLSHEFEHFLEDMGLITRFEQAVLDAAIKKQEKAGTLPFNAAPNGKRMGGAELRAYFVQHALEKRDFQRKTTLGRVLQKVADFVDALVNLAVRTSRGIVRDVESGKMMDKEASSKRKFILPMLQAAYHGSPHRFDKFTLDAMGTGEGAQAYGWGLYFAGKKEVAGFYQQKLAGWKYKYRGKDILSRGFIEKLRTSKIVNAMLEEIQKSGMVEAMIKLDGYIANPETAKSSDINAFRSASLDDMMEAAQALHEIERSPKGQLYKVEIPEDDVMLHWDLPLSEQPEKVKAALMEMMKAWEEIPNGDDLDARLKYHFGGRDVRGDFLYNLLAEKYGADKEMTGGWTAKIKDDKAASEYLNSIGIKGIKYLDGTSRSNGEGSYNYVLFDDSAIEILETYYQVAQAQAFAGYQSVKSVDTPAFKKWFGDSKAVDENGNPLVVYHGTPTGGFEAFDPAHQGRTGGRARGGFSFTTNRAAAETYANAYSDESVALDEGIMIANAAMNRANDNEEVLGILRDQFDATDTAPQFYWGAVDDNAEFADYLDEIADAIRDEDGGIADELVRAASVIRRGVEAEPQVYEVYLKVPPEAPEFDATPETLGEVVANLDVRNVPGRAAVINMPNGEKVFYVADPGQIKAVNNRGTFDPADQRIQYSLATKARELASDIMHRPEVFGPLKFVQTQYHKKLKNADYGRVWDRVHEAASTQARAAARAAQLAPDILPDHAGSFMETVRELSPFAKKRFTNDDLKTVSRVMSIGTLAGKDPSPTSGHRLTDDELASLERGEKVMVGDQEIGMTKAQVALYRQARQSVDQMVMEMATSEAWRNMRGALTEEAREAWRTFAENPNGAEANMNALLDAELRKAEARLAKAEADAFALGGVDTVEDFGKYGDGLRKLRDKIKRIDKFTNKQKEDGDLDAIIAKRQEEIDAMADKLGIDADNVTEELKDYVRAAKELKAASGQITTINEARESIVGIFEQANKLISAGYVPLSRFGKYRINVHGKDGKLIYVGMYDTSTEGNMERRKLVQAFAASDPGATVGAVIRTSDEAWKLYQGANPDALMLFASKAGAKDHALMQAYYRDALSSRSALKRLIARKGYAGYSEDLQRILASFITSGSKRIGTNYHSADITDMLGQMKEKVDKGQLAGDVLDEAVNMKKYVDDPGDAGSGFRSFAANWYMLGSFMSAAWNGTQVLTSTLPELYKHSGSVKKSFMDIFGAYRTMVRKGADLTADELGAVKRAEQDGTVDAAETFHLWGLATKRFINKLGNGEVARKTGAFLRLWGMPFAWFETVNRKASFIAAYRQATDMGMKGEEAYAWAKQIVDITQGVYQKHNRVNVARSAVGGAVMTFMQYKIMTLEQIARNAKGDGKAKRAAALQLAIIAAMGGWAALPGVEDIMDLLDAIMQIIGGEAWLTKKKMRAAIENGGKEAAGLVLEKAAADAVGQFMADFVNTGISTILPFDVQSRAGMDNIIPGVGLLKPSTQYRDSEVFAMAGVPGSMVESLLDATSYAFRGDIGRATMRLAPNALAAAAKGADIAMTGEIRNNAGKKITDGNILDAALQGFGAQPKDKARIGARLRENQELKYLTQQEERSIVNEWADAYEKKGVVAQSAALKSVRERIAEWNRKNPEWPIVVKQSQVMTELKNRKKTTVELAAKSAPKELRKSMAVE